jgi:hypothetical protein
MMKAMPSMYVIVVAMPSMFVIVVAMPSMYVIVVAMPSMYVIVVALLPVCSRNQCGKVSLIPVEKNCRFVSFFTCSGRHLLVNPSAGIRS